MADGNAEKKGNTPAENTGNGVDTTPAPASTPKRGKNAPVEATYATRVRIGNLSMPVYKLDAGAETPEVESKITFSVNGKTHRGVVKAILNDGVAVDTTITIA